MLKRTALTLYCTSLLVSLSFAQSASQATRKNSSLTLLTVNKSRVSADEFIYLYKKNHQDPKKDFTSDKINEYLDLFINFKLKV
jgi:peptidyl-prolyl cis-trans isomerase SurA